MKKLPIGQLTRLFIFDGAKVVGRQGYIVGKRAIILNTKGRDEVLPRQAVFASADAARKSAGLKPGFVLYDGRVRKCSIRPGALGSLVACASTGQTLPGLAFRTKQQAINSLAARARRELRYRISNYKSAARSVQKAKKALAKLLSK